MCHICDGPSRVSQAWAVYNRKGIKVNTVFFDAALTSDEVYHILIESQGFNPSIRIKKENKDDY